MSKNQEANQDNSSVIASIFGLVVGLCIFLAFESNRDMAKAYLGLSTPMDEAFNVGVSTKADSQEYQHEGGLSHSNRWRNFEVLEYKAIYDESNILGALALKLSKNAIVGTDASLASIRKKLKEECGTDWKTNAAGNGIYIERADGTGCTALDQGELSVELTVARVPANKAAAVGAPPTQSPPAVQTPSVVPATQEAQTAVLPLKVTNILPYTEGRSYLVKGTIVSTGDPATSLFKLAQPITIDQKLDVGNGTVIGDVQDGRQFTEFEIDNGENLGGIPAAGILGEYVVTIVCPRAGCWIQTIKTP